MASQRVIGVDLGGTKLLAGIVERDGVVVERSVRPTDVRSQDALLAELEGLIGEMLPHGVGAIGVAIPSTIDQRSGRAVASVNIPLAELGIRDWSAIASASRRRSRTTPTPRRSPSTGSAPAGGPGTCSCSPSARE